MKNHQPDFPRSCSLLTIRVIIAGTSRKGNSAKTSTACVATIVHTIWKIMPPNTNHQYSEREERPLKLKEFDTPLFMASMNGILLAGLSV